MDFRILGPLELREEGRDVPLRGGKQRALLALLLLNANRTLALDRIVDDLWGDDVPATAQKMVQIYVSHLRKALPAETLRTRPPGYLIEVGEGELDLEHFERMLAEGRRELAEERPAEASAALRRALSLWRGPALAEFSEPFARPEGARLEELRQSAHEERIEADLALGRHADLVGELETLVARNPLRERLRGQQMLALYRAGRQADALAAYQRGRRQLDGLGISPSPALKDLERRILQQDPALVDGGSVNEHVKAHRSPVSTIAVGPAPVRYTRSGELNIAYQITGGGPVDVVLVPGFVSHLEKDWEEPRHAHFLERLASFSRLIRFDKRGTGLSDRPAGVPDLETRMDDVRAVMDAAESERAILFGYSEGGPMSILFAASHPARVLALVVYGSYAKRLDPGDDYPWAPTRERRRAYAEQLEQEWGFEADMRNMCPSADDAMSRWWGERTRAAASPGAVRSLIEMNSQIDVRAVLSTIHLPTLVMHRSEDADSRVDEGRYLADHIPGALFVELAGADHFVAMNPDQILDVVEPFVADVAGFVPSPLDHRVLATLLVIDIVGSTETAARLGDDAWGDLRRSFHAAVRAELTRFAGEELDVAGDGVFALFDGPARAIRCALAARARLAALGLEVRTGLHTGEIERRGAEASGIALHVAARVAAAAEPGEVFVTATTRDIVAGSGLDFEDRGERLLKGFDEARRLYAATGSDNPHMSLTSGGYH